jgi:hypothetical protein
VRSPIRFVLSVLLSVLTTTLAATSHPLSAQGVPTPESVLGFAPGADFHLATYEQSVSYFQALAAASDRVQLVKTGRTSEGRDWYIALISSPENLKNVEHYREIHERLADPQSLTDEEARALAREGKAIVDINGGLHATEVAGSEVTIKLAYDLAANPGKDSRIDNILNNVVVVIWPSLNPDGQTMVADWYQSNLGTPYEVSPLPRLWQKYVGHDNNRDAYMLNMIESRQVERTWRHWEPDIIHVHHQTAPFPTRIWLPPFAEPVASDVPALMSREVNTVGMAMAQLLDSEGLPGATHMGTGFDAWYPGYIDYMPMLQHQVSFWTETALYRYATPHFYTLSDFPEDYRDLRPQSLYSSPWPGGWWHIADAVQYMEVASIAVLDYAAKYREDVLYNRYQSGRDVVARYASGAPYAWFVPQDQRDPVAPVELLRRLAYNGIHVTQLDKQVTQEGLTYPAGTWVIPMNQPFGELARQVLEVQHYPDLRQYPQGPPEQPYDASGWTLPYQMGLRVMEATQPLSEDVRAAMKPVEGEALAWDAEVADASPFDEVPGVGFDDNAEAAGIRPPAGRITGSGDALWLDPAQNNSFKAMNEAWDAGARVRYTSDLGGRYVVTGLSGATADRLARDLALQASRGPATGTDVPRPRVGLYRPWTASMDEGWSRWLLERYGFRFESLYNADVQAGDLSDRYDVIVIPAARSRSLMDGYAEGTVPPRYAGGLGEPGIRALEAFVRAGGTLVCMNESSEMCIAQLHLPVKNAVAGVRRQDFFASGSILQVRTDPGHPLMAGMPEMANVFFDSSPVFAPEDGFEGTVVSAYPTDGSPLMSGYLLGEQHLQGWGAEVVADVGAGHVVLIGFRPQWRGQPFGTFRVLFNSILFHGRVAQAKGTAGFWTAPKKAAEEAAAPAPRGRNGR